MWEREQEYKTELEQVILKAATSRLDRLASLALEDDRACYKHVMVLLEKQYRKCGTNMRGKLHLLYCVSTLLRQSRKQQGPRDRYAERLQPLTAALVIDLRLQYSAQVDKLLKLWRMEGVFSPEQLVEVESGRSALALQQTGTQSKSPSGSLSAQDPHMGFGDASGSGRSSAIQSHPPFAASGRAAPLVPGALPSYHQQQQAEGQDPYSADSNPNGARSAAPPPPALPPPPPASLIPPGLLGPVGPPPPGMLAPGSAAAAAAAVAGLFPQGQLGGFLGPSPGSLMQQGVFMAPIGPFGGGSMGGGMPGAMAGGMGQGMAVSVGSVMGGAMNGGMPFQGPPGPGPMPPGLGLQRPPLYPQPPMYGSQAQGQSHGSRGLNRFSQPSGRMPPGLGPSSGPGPGGAHGQGQGWQGRFGQEGQSAAAQPLPPPPPRPPPGSPPQGADGRGSGAAAVAAPPAANAPAPAMNGMYKGNSWLDGNSAVVPPGLGNSSNAAGGDVRAGSANSGASSAHGAAPTGHIRPSGRRSRWELERDSNDAPAAVAATAAAEPVAKRPALAVEGGGGAPVHAAEAAPAKSSEPAPSPPPPRAPSPPPPPPPLPSPPRNGGDDVTDLAAVPDDSGQAEAGPSPAVAVAAVAGQRQLGEGAERGHSALSPSPPQQQRHAEPEPAPGASTPMDTVGEEGPACGQGAEDVAVADGKADPDGVSEPEERGARGAVAEETVSGRQQQHGAQGALVVTAGKPEAQGRGEVGEVVVRPREAAEGPAEAVEMDDGGSSSAEAVCPAARHHDSTAPATPGRLSGAAEQRESRNGASGQDEQQQEQEQEQQQRRSSSSGAGESGYDGPSMTVPSEAQAAVDGAPVGQAGAGAQEQLQLPQQAGEAKSAEAGMSTNQLSSAERCGAQQQLAGHDVQSADQPVQQPTEAAADAPAPAAPPTAQSCSQSEPEPEPESQAAPGCADGAEAGLRLDMVGDGVRGVGGDGVETGDEAPVVKAPPAAAPEAAEAPAEAAASEAALPSAPSAAADGAAAADAAAAAVAEAPALMSCPAQEATVQLQPSAENDAPTSVSDRASQPADGAQPVVEAPASCPPQAAQPAPALAPPLPPPAPAQQQQQQTALQNSSTLQLSSYETSRGGGVAEELEELELGDFDESWLE